MTSSPLSIEKSAKTPTKCGGGGIRTHGELAPSAVFKTAAFDRSATPPGNEYGLVTAKIGVQDRSRRDETHVMLRPVQDRVRPLVVVRREAPRHRRSTPLVHR